PATSSASPSRCLAASQPPGRSSKLLAGPLGGRTVNCCTIGPGCCASTATVTVAPGPQLLVRQLNCATLLSGGAFPPLPVAQTSPLVGRGFLVLQSICPTGLLSVTSKTVPPGTVLCSVRVQLTFRRWLIAWVPQPSLSGPPAGPTRLKPVAAS